MLSLENQARVVTRDELLNQIWGYEYDGETRTLDMHHPYPAPEAGEEGGSCIKTVRGVGYRLVRSETKGGGSMRRAILKKFILVLWRRCVLTASSLSYQQSYDLKDGQRGYDLYS